MTVEQLIDEWRAISAKIECRLREGQILFGSRWEGWTPERAVEEAGEEFEDAIIYTLFAMLLHNRATDATINRKAKL